MAPVALDAPKRIGNSSGALALFRESSCWLDSRWLQLSRPAAALEFERERRFTFDLSIVSLGRRRLQFRVEFLD